MSPTPSEDGLFVEFLFKPVLQGKQSRDAGREIYQDIEYVDIQVRGMPQSRVQRTATAQDRKRFATEHQAFLDGKAVASSGTPLEHLAGMSPTRALELRQAKVYTIEQLSERGDSIVDEFSVGSRKLRDDAKAFLSARADSSVVAALREQNAALTDKLAALTERIESIETETS